MPRRKAQRNREAYQSFVKAKVELELSLSITELPPPPPKGKKHVEEAYEYAGMVARRADDLARGFILENLRWNAREWPQVKRSTVKGLRNLQEIQNSIIRQLTGEEIY